jgi:hypothetical protein
MEDKEFFETLLEMWQETSYAEDRYWGYSELDDGDGGSLYDLFAFSSDDDQEFIGYFCDEADANFVTALHGCFPDLIRRVLTAIGEADQLDEEMDVVQAQLAEAEVRVMELKQQVADYEADLQGLIGR